MSHHLPDLIDAIDRFVAATGISEITFGRKALRDPHFVRDLRNGRRVWPETEAKVRAFMRGERKILPGDAAAGSQGVDPQSPSPFAVEADQALGIERRSFAPDELPSRPFEVPNDGAEDLPAVAICEVCDERIEGVPFACSVTECPHAVRKVA